MKKLLLVIILSAAASTAFAQRQPVTTTTYSYPSQKVFSGNIGMNRGAFNVGVAMDMGKETGAFGGSFFLQTEKKENNSISVYQVMTFGAHVNLNLMDANSWIVGLRPGVNISMIKDVPSTSSSGKSDKTVFGPSYRLGVAHKLASGSEIGVERLEVWNWLDDEAPGEAVFTSIVFRTQF